MLSEFPNTFEQSDLPPLSLYVHFPWCVAKCPYCDFNSHTIRGTVPGDEYIRALVRELEHVATSVGDRTLLSMFFGGGTPSVFSPEQLARLLESINSLLHVDAQAEVTLEANPGTIEHGSFKGYRDAGINRLSLGVQSFADAKLKALGRIHDAATARQAYLDARQAGFENINLDLMYALPEQTLNDAQADVAAAIELSPEHISLYHLTLEPNTVFYAQPPVLPDDDLAWEMQHRASESLAENGYVNYEVSAWASAGSECLHNLNYWRYGDYLGIGAGAHSKVTDTAGIKREQRVAHPQEYLKRCQDGDAIAKQVTVGSDDRLFEFMLNNLRLREGFSLRTFSRYTGLEPSVALPGLNRAEKRGLIGQMDQDCWRPTEQGWRFLNDLQAYFVPE